MRVSLGIARGNLFPEVMETEAPKDFFISYNSKDRDWAEWIAWHLEEAGFRTVLQAWDFRTGSIFVLNMQQATTGTGGPLPYCPTKRVSKSVLTKHD